MSYEDAFHAFRDADYSTAVLLLERAAQETGFNSDVLNDAYTLALYQAGEKDRLADVAFQIGDSLAEVAPSAAMDYFQRAFLGSLDAACVRHVASLIEKWAAPARPFQDSHVFKKVAHVVGAAHPDHAPARQVQLLSDSMQQHGIDSAIFTTEWSAGWFFNSKKSLISESVNDSGRTRIASTAGDFTERAARIAAAIQDFGADAVFFHSSLSELITARVAAFRPGPIQINVDYGREMEAGLFDGYVHLTRHGLSSSRHHHSPGAWIPPASDVRTRIWNYPDSSRQVMGLEQAASVSATLGDFRNVSESGYLRVVGDLLHRFPGHFHLFAGLGEVKPVRAYLHAEGVLSRVRFLGTHCDAASLLPAIDIYLAPFPNHDDGLSLIEAMGADKPVVVMEAPKDLPRNSGADIVGIPDLVARNEGEYAQIAQHLISDAGFRSQAVDLVRSRFDAEFDPSVLGPRYVRFLQSIVESIQPTR